MGILDKSKDRDGDGRTDRERYKVLRGNGIAKFMKKHSNAGIKWDQMEKCNRVVSKISIPNRKEKNKQNKYKYLYGTPAAIKRAAKIHNKKRTGSVARGTEEDLVEDAEEEKKGLSAGVWALII